MIQLQFKHLLYDIEQQTYALAEARVKNNPELKAEMQTDELHHLSDIAMRFCEEGCALLNTLLKDKLKPTSPASEPQEETPVTETDALTYNDKNWDFDTTLEKPDEHTLATLFHRFVVAYFRWQWAKLYSPEEASALQKQMLELQKEIENIIYTLGTPVKRRPICFDLQAPEIEVNWTT